MSSGAMKKESINVSLVGLGTQNFMFANRNSTA
jgi:hypothetical protein